MTKNFPSDVVIPEIDAPEGIEKVLSLTTEQFLSIEDADLALGLQHTLAKYICYVRQQYNLAKSALSFTSDRFDDLLSVVSEGMPKSLTIKEKTMRALVQSEELRNIRNEMAELKSKTELLNEWDTKLQLLHDAIKQLYYRLRSLSYDE